MIGATAFHFLGNFCSATASLTATSQLITATTITRPTLCPDITGEVEHAALADALASIGKAASGRRRSRNGEMTRGRGGDVESSHSESEAVDSSCAVSFDLLIASDVIYSVSVVEPLFETVGALLAGGGGVNGQQGGIESGEHVNQAAGEEQGPQQPQQSLQASLPLKDDCAATLTTSAAAGSTPTPSRTAPRLEAPSTANSRCTTPSGTEASSRYFSTHMSAHGPTATPAPLFVMSQSFLYEAETEEAITRACERRGLLREVVWDELHSAEGGGGSSSSSRGDDCADSSEVLREGGSKGHTGDADNSDVSYSRGSCRVEADGACAEGEREDEHRLGHAGGVDGEGSQGEAVRRAGTKLQLFWRL